MRAGWTVPRGLATVLVADLLIGTGNWAFMIALAVSAQERGGPGAVGLLAAARMLPATLAAPIVGRWLDRMDRGRAVVLSTSAQSVCFGTAAALIATRSSLPLIAVATVCGSATASAPRPALEALIPALATHPDEVTRASAHWATVESAGALIGSGLGGLAIALVGSGAIAAVAALSIAAAAALAATLPRAAATEGDDEETTEAFSGMLAGARAVVRSPLLRAPFALFIGMVLLEGSTDVQLVTLAIHRLHLGSGGPGAFFAIWGVGGTLAGLGLTWLLRRRGYGLVLSVGGVMFGIAIALTGLGGEAVALAAMVPAGLGFALVQTGIVAVIPRLADDAIVGRVYGLMEMVYTGGTGIGALLAPGLIRLVGVGASLLLVGVGLLLVALAVLPALVRLDTHQERATRIRTLLHGIPCLGALPLPRLERLVQAAEPLQLPAGTTVIEAGEPGDAFYALERGEVEIVEVGRRQGPGTGFGEVSLLRDVARTATVRCVTDADLVVIRRPQFVSAVTASGAALALADAMVAEHTGGPVGSAA